MRSMNGHFMSCSGSRKTSETSEFWRIPLRRAGFGTRTAIRRIVVAAALLLVAGAPGWAKNIDLSTVPDRDTVQLTIYNSEDLTLVRETRNTLCTDHVDAICMIRLALATVHIGLGREMDYLTRAGPLENGAT